VTVLEAYPNEYLDEDVPAFKFDWHNWQMRLTLSQYILTSVDFQSPVSTVKLSLDRGISS
jgi:hypothetical protein